MENNNLQYKNFTFIVLKLYNEGIIVPKNLRLIRKEPIDALIKYIDLNYMNYSYIDTKAKVKSLEKNGIIMDNDSITKIG